MTDRGTRDVLTGATRAVDPVRRQVRAKVCSYDAAPDTYGTRWAPGVFDKGLRAALPAVCWAHDSRDVIGSVTSYDSRPDGLYVDMQLADPDEVPSAKRAFSLIRDGHVKGWSFGFSDAVSEPDPTYKGALRFRSARMYEVSPVLRASVPGTVTIGVRSADNAQAYLRTIARGVLRSGGAADMGTATLRAADLLHRWADGEGNVTDKTRDRARRAVTYLPVTAEDLRSTMATLDRIASSGRPLNTPIRRPAVKQSGTSKPTAAELRKRDAAREQTRLRNERFAEEQAMLIEHQYPNGIPIPTQAPTPVSPPLRWDLPLEPNVPLPPEYLAYVEHNTWQIPAPQPPRRVTQEMLAAHLEALPAGADAAAERARLMSDPTIDIV